MNNLNFFPPKFQPHTPLFPRSQHLTLYSTSRTYLNIVMSVVSYLHVQCHISCLVPTWTVPCQLFRTYLNSVTSVVSHIPVQCHVSRLVSSWTVSCQLSLTYLYSSMLLVLFALMLCTGRRLVNFREIELTSQDFWKSQKFWDV